MSTKLTQKGLLKGSQAFEIDGEDVIVRTQARFKEEEVLTVRLSVLNPEPVINKSRLEFVSRINGEPLLSLFLAKPNVTEFNEFVNTLKQTITSEYNAFVGMKSVTQPQALAGNVYDEAPEFKESSTAEIAKTKKVRVADLESSIKMLETYVKDDDVKVLLDALIELKQDVENPAKLAQVATAFNALESQGAVLTYAPYISIMLSDDPFGF